MVSFNTLLWRQDFPFLSSATPLIFLDNAATTQKPFAVIDRLAEVYKTGIAPLYRSLYDRAEELTLECETVRKKCAELVGALSSVEIVFTSSATAALTIIALGWAEKNLKPGDEIVVCEFDHHANILPWLMLAQRKYLSVLWIRATSEGLVDEESVKKILQRKPALLAITAYSNALGDIEFLAPYFQGIFLKTLITHTQNVGGRVVLDASQYMPHKKFLLTELPADFVVWSSHKMLGPAGVGILYCSQRVHHELSPAFFGGGMVAKIEDENHIEWREMPALFEAGSLPAAEIIAYGVALEYVQNIGFSAIVQHESTLRAHLLERLSSIKGVSVFAPSGVGSIVSFIVEDIHAHDVAAALARKGIAVRAGNHCARFLHDRLSVSASVRISSYLYTTREELDLCANVLEQLISSWSLV